MIERLSLPNALCMASGIMPEASPVQLVEAAAAAGFDYAGMWIEPAEWTDQTTRDVKAAMRAFDMPLIDVEVVWLKPGPHDPHHDRIVNIGMEVGARNVLCVTSDPDDKRTAEKLRRLAERAGRDIRINLEFGLFTEVKSLQQASAIIRDIDHPAMGLLVDALHWRRSGGTIDALREVPQSWLSYVQLCDAPDPGADATNPDEILVEAIDGRLPLGEGGLPLHQLYTQLPAAIPISVEERSKTLRDQYPDLHERARAVLKNSQNWLLNESISS